MFDLTETASLARKVEPTKRNVISTVSKFYDPLGVISPIVVQFEILFQELCKEKRTGTTHWKVLASQPGRD